MKKITDETLILKNFLKSIANTRADSDISYDEIEAETGIEMDDSGRRILRNAARYAGVEYVSIRSYGIHLAGANTGTQVVGHRLARIDSATRRAEKTVKRISTQFLDQMDTEDQKAMIFLGSVFGAIRASADSYKRMTKFKRDKPKLVNTGG